MRTGERRDRTSAVSGSPESTSPASGTEVAGPDPRRWLPRAAALVAGAALVLAVPAPSAWWWAFVGLVPILLLVARSGDRREAVWRSWLAASGYFTALHYWVLAYLSIFAVPLAVLLGVMWVPWGLVAWELLNRPPSPRRVAVAVALLPAVWVVIEFVRSWDRFGGSWGYLGLTQWNAPLVLSIAALGGVWALSVLLVAVNVGVTVALSGGVRPASRIAGLATAVVMVGATVLYGAARPEPDVEGRLHVGGVQPGRIVDPEARLDENIRLTRQLVEREPDVEVVVWGQSSVGFDPSTDEEVGSRLANLARDIDRQLVVNVDARRPDGRIAKTMVVIDPDGRFGETYQKQRLVPFGEYIPLRSVFGWVERFTQAANEDRQPGTSLTTIRLAGEQVGPLISYESTFPDMRRTLARRDVEVTLVQAAATSFQGTWALPQQGSFEAVRAVESGRPAVLVAVSGNSSAFDPRGERLAWIPQDRTGAWSVEVPLSREDTLFVRWGPWVPVGSMAILGMAAVVALGRTAAPRWRALRWSRLSRRAGTARSARPAPGGACW